MREIVTNSVVSLFLIMMVGVFSYRMGIITNEVNRGINNILVKISLPMLILSSFMTTFEDNMMDNVKMAFLYSIVALFLVFVASNILALGIKGNKKNAFIFCNIFTNTGFIGIPILNAIYGSEGVIYGAAYSMFFNLFVFTYGMMLYKGFDKGDKFWKQIFEVFKNPVIVAVFIGIAVMFFSIPVPSNIQNSIKLIGSMTTPLSMMSIGFILGQVKLKDYLGDWTLFYGLIIKLILLPLIIILFFRAIGNTSTVANAIVFQTALPAATLASIFADRFNKEREYTTIFVVTSTLLSMLTIPIIVGIFFK